MEPLQKMGAKIEEIQSAKGRFIRVRGGAPKGGNFRIAVASAQLKSALLLAGLASGQKVSVSEPTKSRDHSERMLKAFGADIRVKGLKVTLVPGRRLRAQKVVVPGDFSSAAFFLVAALISQDPRTRVVVRHVGLNETRVGALEILRKMGGKLRVFNKKTVCGEPVGDIEARASSLHGVAIRGKILPRLIDEVPILCVAAAVAKGRTIIRDAEELRIKESDRIRALAAELPRFGIEVKEFKDGLEIRGHESIAGGRGQSYGDHRIAMSLAVLGTVARGLTTVDDVDCIATSFPTFIPLLRKVGGKITARG
jgi:3-phosphoshikimate 1-carboxyvinyltransferase